MPIICIFHILRIQQKDIYLPKLRLSKSRTPEEPAAFIFSWIPHVLSVSDAETLRMVGADAFMLLRFTRMCAIFSILTGILAMGILVPVYATAPTLSGGINRWTMGNLNIRSNRLYAPLVFEWLFTLFYLGLIYREYHYYSLLHHRFVHEGDPNIPAQSTYSCLLYTSPSPRD